MSDKLKICMLVPAYNEGKTISRVVEGCLQYVSDVIVVDDGSEDNTAEQAKRAGAEVLTHDKNRGKGAALKTGFDRIIDGGWEALMVIDSDGQHDWNEIPIIIKKTVDENAAITIGSRMEDVENMPFLRKAVNYTTSWIISKLAGQHVPDSQCGFRLIRTNVLKELGLVTENFEMESEMLIIAGRKGYKISHVPIKTIYHSSRQRIGPGRDTWKFIKLFVAHMLRLR